MELKQGYEVEPGIFIHSRRTPRRACRTCQSTEFKWAHDTNRPTGTARCDDCQVTGKFVQYNLDGSRHDHSAKAVPVPEPVKAGCAECGNDTGNHFYWCKHAPEPVTAEVVKAEPVPEVWPAPAGTVPAAPAAAPSADPRASAIAQLLDTLAPKVDRSEVEEIVTSAIAATYADLKSDFIAKADAKIAELSAPLKIEVTTPKGTVKIDGAHSILPKVIRVMNAPGITKNVMLVGPAGTGKSHIATNVAEALGLALYEISLSPDRSTTAILGYMQAAGEYVRTLFREAFENGGLFHFDEFDNGHPSILAVINAALSNGHMAFPDGMVKRHPDFRVIASANTYGRGADRAYVGRQAIDAATLNRFVVIPVDVDNALERAICDQTGADSDTVTQVLAYVRALRKAAEQYKMPVVFGVRESEGMCSLLAAGLSLADAIDYRVRRGLSDADWNKVSSNAVKPHVS